MVSLMSTTAATACPLPFLQGEIHKTSKTKTLQNASLQIFPGAGGLTSATATAYPSPCARTTLFHQQIACAICFPGSTHTRLTFSLRSPSVM